MNNDVNEEYWKEAEEVDYDPNKTVIKIPLPLP